VERTATGAVLRKRTYPKGEQAVVEIVDSIGRPITNRGSYTRVDQTFDDKGRVIKHVYRDAFGRPATDEDGWFGYETTFGPDGLAREFQLLTADGTAVKTPDGAARVTFERNARGQVTRYTVVDGGGRPTADERGCVAMTTIYDDAGNETSMKCFGVKVVPALSRIGNHAGEYGRDDTGRITKLRLLDAAGDSVVAAGLQPVEYVYDAAGRVGEVRTVDATGTLLAAGAEQAKTLYTYDELGRVVEKRGVDPTGRPAFVGFSGHCHVQRFIYDGVLNKVARIEYFDIGQKPCTGKYGYSVHRISYDEGGRSVSDAYFDIYGKPVVSLQSRVHASQLKYDAFGRIAELRNIGIDGVAAPSSEGFASARTTYESKDRIELIEYLGVDDRPSYNKSGCAASRVRRDERGAAIEWQCLDESKRLTVGAEGYSIMRIRREHGREVERSFHGVDGRPVSNAMRGVARETATYDAGGRLLGKRFFDETGAAVADIEHGAPGVRFSYDGRGFLVRTETTGPTGELQNAKNGVAVRITEIDARGRVAGESYLGVSQTPALNDGGCGAFRMEYDELGRVTGQTCLSEKGGMPKESARGPAHWRRSYDDRGRLARESFLGATGEPRPLTGGNAATEYLYAESNLVTEQRFLGADGALLDSPTSVAISRYRYDDRGNRVETRHLDARQRPHNAQPGKSETFDDRDRLRRQVWLDGEGAPSRKFLITERRYDERGRLMVEFFVTADKRPAASINGVAKTTYTYDESGKRAQVSYFDAGAQPVMHRKEGAAVVRYRYDEAGRERVREYLDLNGRVLREVREEEERARRLAADETKRKRDQEERARREALEAEKRGHVEDEQRCQADALCMQKRKDVADAAQRLRLDKEADRLRKAEEEKQACVRRCDSASDPGGCINECSASHP